MHCKSWEGQQDEMCEDFIKFIEKHNITCMNLSSKSHMFSIYVEFTGKAKDIIKLVLTYFADFVTAPKYVIESAYEIIFQG
jgi:hypothetical protein